MKDKAIREAADDYYRTLTAQYPELAAALRERFTAYPKDSDGVCWLADTLGERRPFPSWTAAAEARKAAILRELQQETTRNRWIRS
jgi:hypothetical protein